MCPLPSVQDLRAQSASTRSPCSMTRTRLLGQSHKSTIASAPACYDPGAMAQEQQTTRCPQCGKSFPATVKLCPDDGTVLEHAPPTTSQVGKVLDGKYRLDAFLSK